LLQCFYKTVKNVQIYTYISSKIINTQLNQYE